MNFMENIRVSKASFRSKFTAIQVWCAAQVLSESTLAINLTFIFSNNEG